MMPRSSQVPQPSARKQVLLLSLTLLTGIAACSDEDPGGVKAPELPENPNVQTLALVCTGSARTREVLCRPADPTVNPANLATRALSQSRGGLWTASAQQAQGDTSLIIGGQGINVTLTSSNITYTVGTEEFAFDVAIKNHIGQSLGTTDGATLHPMGVRVFFQQLPMPTDGLGGASFPVVGAGTSTFTAADQPYYQFDEIIADEHTSGTVRFKFTIPPDRTFIFRVLVWAPVQWPDGWVSVSPGSYTLNLGDAAQQSTTLTSSVYNRVGILQAEAVTWASSNGAVATVNSSGVVTGIGAGTASITASAVGRATGSAIIDVIQPADTATSQVTALDATLVADGSSTTTVTVQLKDALGNNLTHNAGTVTLTSSAGASLGAVSYTGNGSYSATLTAPTTVGFDVIKATLNGDTITDSAAIEYTPGAPTALVVQASDTSPNAGAVISVTAQLVDLNGNPVKTSNVSVGWSASNGGSFAATETTTDGNGVATAQFTVGGVGGTTHLITADAGSGVVGSSSVTVVNIAPVGGPDSYNNFGNVTLNVSSVDGLLANDVSNDGGTFAAVADSVATTQGGSARIAADGSFSYFPSAGFTGGNDTFQYVVEDQAGAADTVLVTIAVSRMYWFVQENSTGTGTQANPAGTIAAAVASATAGDTILIATGSYAGATLKNGQYLRGSSNDSAMVRMLNSQSITLLAAGSRPTINTTLTVALNNALQNLDVSTNGNAIAGTSFGTLTIRSTNVSANSGAALMLTTGTVDASIGTLSANAGSNSYAVRLTGVAGTLTATSGSLSNGTSAALGISGGTVSLNYSGTISKSIVDTAPVVLVDGGHATGTLTLGAINATEGAGIRFDNADGIYNLNGQISVSGNATAGISIINGSSGTFNISDASSSLQPNGTGLNVTTGTPNVTYAGAIAVTNGLVASITSRTGGSVTVTGAISGTTQGILVQDNTTASGANTVSFTNGSKTITVTGSNAGVRLNNNGSAVAVSFSGGGLRINSTSGTAFSSASGGTLRVTGAGNWLRTVSGSVLDLQNSTIHADGIAFDSVRQTAGTVAGINLSSLSGSGTVAVLGAGAADTGGGLSSTSSPVSIANMTTVPVTLNYVNVAIGTGGTDGLVAATFGTLTLNGVSINTTTGRTLNLNAGTISGSATLTSTTANTSSVLLQSMAGTLTAGGSLVGAVRVNGGTVSLTYTGNLSNQTSGAPLLLVNGGHATGTVAFNTGTLNDNAGIGLQFDNADGTYNFNGTTTLGGGDAGIDVLNSSDGTFSFGTNATITNPTNEAIRVSSSSPNFTYNGRISKTNGLTGIAVTSAGGTVNLGSRLKQISSTTSTAVNLSSNTGTITSGDSLQITTTSGTGFNATVSGTVNVLGNSNTVSSGTGTAVNINAVTIGASGIRWLSVSNSGAANGIALVNTGNSGGVFTVSGNSTHGSGGTIINSSGADGAQAGNGIYLSNSSNVSLAWMNLSGHANHAVRGVNVSNVTLNRLRITGTNGTNVGADEGSVSFDNLTGTASITSSYIEGGVEDNVRVVNTSGILNRLTMNNDTIGHNGTSGNAGVLLNGLQTAELNATVQNSRFTGSRSNNIMYVMNENSKGDVVISNNTLTNNHPNKLGSDFGIYVAHASSGAVTYSVATNSVNNAGGAAIEVDRGAGSTGTMTGTINGNTVGTAGVANSGSNAGSGIFVALVGAGSTATHNTTITNNTIRQFTNYGIELLNSGTGNGYLNATVTGNNIAQPSPNSVTGGFPTSGIRATLGVSSGPPAHDGRTCLNISGNTVNQTGTSISAEIRVWGRFGSRTGLPGLTGSGANALISGQNTITVAPGGFGAVNATSTNAFQSTCPPV